MVLDNGILVAALVDEMGETAENRVAKGSLTSGNGGSSFTGGFKVSERASDRGKGLREGSREGSSDASRGRADRAPNWRDKGVREGTPDPRGAE